MKRRKQRRFLPLVISFFMGVIATLLILVPGKTGPTLLVSGDTQLQRQQFGKAGEKIEKIGDNLLAGLYHTKEFVQKNLDSTN
jgi:hypothetical protein